jgi:hypothetical protein
MKGKGLVPLLIIALILVGLVIWKRSSTPAPTLREQVNLVALLPQDAAAEDVARLELYSGANPEDRLVLVRDDAQWRVQSHFDAPAADAKIQEYIEALDELQGEFRERAASEAVLRAFDLTDDAAFHVVGYKQDAEDPAFHLLVGKAADYRTVFMRLADEPEVYVEDTNLRQLAGIYGDDAAAAPAAAPWLDKTVVKVDQQRITKLELTSPDKALVFERQEVLPEAPEEPSEDAAPLLQPAPEHRWVVASGGPGGVFREAGLTSVLRKVADLTATDVVDPALLDQWGLNPPQFRAVASVEGEDDVVIEGGRPEGSPDGYIRLASASDDLVYKLDTYGFNQLFPKGSQLFELPALGLEAESLERIEVTQPEGAITLVRSEDEWVVEAPQANLPVQATTINTLELAIKTWLPDDYADADANTGLDAPDRSVTFTANGAQHTLHVGGPSAHFDGYYAQLAGEDLVLGMTKADYQKIFIKPSNLYQLALMDLAMGEVESVAVDRAEDPFSITTTDDGWTFTAGPEGAEVDEDMADDFLYRLLALQASGIHTQTGTTGAAVTTIRVTGPEGVAHTLAIDPEQDGRYPVTLVEKNQAVWVDAADLDEVLVPSAALAREPAPADIMDEDESLEPAVAEATAEPTGEDS